MVALSKVRQGLEEFFMAFVKLFRAVVAIGVNRDFKRQP